MMNVDIDYISPKELLGMTVKDYLDKYGSQQVSDRLLSIVHNRLNTKIRHTSIVCLGERQKSVTDMPILVWDLVRIPIDNLRHSGLGYNSYQYIDDALKKNDLKLGMTDRAVDKYIEDYDINNAMLKSVLERLCNQCIREHKKDIMRTFDRKTEIVPGFVCCVMVSKT